MAILVRTRQEDGSLKESYPSTQIVTQKRIDDAKKLDEKIEKLVMSIENEAEKQGLIDLKKKRKEVIKLYYFVGMKLKPFVENLKLPKGDKQHIWNPINYHSKERPLNPTPQVVFVLL